MMNIESTKEYLTLAKDPVDKSTIADALCKHQNLTFLYPGSGKYDVYKCRNCNDTVNIQWRNY